MAKQRRKYFPKAIASTSATICNSEDKVGRADIDAFETAMRRSKREKGFFVAFDYSEDAMREIGRFFKDDHAVIVPLTVREILDEQIARKLA